MDGRCGRKYDTLLLRLWIAGITLFVNVRTVELL